MTWTDLTLWLAFLLVFHAGAVVGSLLVLAIEDYEWEHRDPRA